MGRGTAAAVVAVIARIVVGREDNSGLGSDEAGATDLALRALGLAACRLTRHKTDRHKTEPIDTKRGWLKLATSTLLLVGVGGFCN